MAVSDQQRELAAFFKPTEDGFVYRAPSGLRIWRSRHFLVGADLRERLIAAAAEPGWVAVAWIAIPWLVVSFGGVVALAYRLGDGQGGALEAVGGGVVFAIVGLVAGIAALSEHKWRLVAPLLRNAPPTAQRLALSEVSAAIRASGGGPSRGQLFGQILGGALMLAAGAFNVSMGIGGLGHRSGVAWPSLLLGAVMMSVGFAVVYVAGRKLANKRD